MHYLTKCFVFFVRAAEPIVNVGICGGKYFEGKYMVSGGKEEWRRKRRKTFGEGKYLVSVGEEEWRRKRRKIFGNRKSLVSGGEGE